MRSDTLIRINDQSPLLVVAEKPPIEIAHQVYWIIHQSEQYDRLQMSSDDVRLGKYIAAIALQLLKTWACAYSYVTIMDLVQLLAKEPFINRLDWKGLPYVAHTSASVFTAAGMYITFIGSKQSVLALCHTENWCESANRLWVKVKCGEFPVLLSITAPCGVIGSGVKAYVGSQYLGNAFFRLIRVNNPWANVGLMGLSILTGLASAFCYLAFQVNQKALQVVKTRAALKQDPDWKMYRTQHRFSLLAKDVAGVFVALVGSALSGMSLFYSNENFKIELLPALYFVFIVISNTMINLRYTTNPGYQYWAIKNEHKHEPCRLCDTNAREIPEFQSESTADHWKKRIKMGIGALNSIGTGLSFAPAILHFILAASRKEDQSQVGMPLAIVGLCLMGLMGCLLWPRDYTMWVRGLFGDASHNRRREGAEEASSQSNIVTIS